MKKKINIVFGIVTIILCSLLLQPVSSLAEDNEELTFNIGVKPLENQINKEATYYDLKVTPNQQQKLTVIVSNTGNDKKKIRVTPTNAITNQNGNVDYSKQGKDYQYDVSLKHPFTSLVSNEQIVEVEPNETKEVVFDLTVPEESFEGIILGGFVADIPDDENQQDDETKGVKIVNKFQLVKGVMLREEETTISPELVLNDVKPDLVSYRTAVVANIQNKEPVMFGELKVDASITEEGKTNVIKHSVQEGMTMAPNSNFDYPIMWDNKQLEPGNYTLNMIATSGEKEWKFTKNFKISAEESKKLNAEAVDLEEPQNKNWLMITLMLVLVILVLLIGWLIYKNHKSKKGRRKTSKRKGKNKKKSKNKKRK